MFKFALVSLLSFLVCLSIVVFFYGQGHSYLSSSSAACANCHVMQDTFDSYRKSNHAHVTGCNSCHVPSNPLMKWPVKAINGLHHSFAFTFLDTPSVIRAGELSSAVVLANCVRCHSSQVNHPVSKASQHSLSSRSCLDCHTEVGHTHK